jgi:hypothetical protein
MLRLRPTLIALAILALSATAVFAAAPGRAAFAPASHHPEASASAKPSEAPEASEIAEATERAEPTEASEPGGSAEASHPVNHGCVVSLAAKTATPSGFKNHGQWVSSIAKDNHGHDQGGDANTCTLPISSPAPSVSANPAKP